MTEYDFRQVWRNKLRLLGCTPVIHVSRSLMTNWVRVILTLKASFSWLSSLQFGFIVPFKTYTCLSGSSKLENDNPK